MQFNLISSISIFLERLQRPLYLQELSIQIVLAYDDRSSTTQRSVERIGVLMKNIHLTRWKGGELDLVATTVNQASDCKKGRYSVVNTSLVRPTLHHHEAIYRLTPNTLYERLHSSVNTNQSDMSKKYQNRRLIVRVE